MRDLAFLAVLVFLGLMAAALWFGVRWAARSRRRALDNARWHIEMHTQGSATSIWTVKVSAHGDELDRVMVGQVPVGHPNYDDQMLDLEAKAQQRLSVLKSIR